MSDLEIAQLPQELEIVGCSQKQKPIKSAAKIRESHPVEAPM